MRRIMLACGVVCIAMTSSGCSTVSKNSTVSNSSKVSKSAAVSKSSTISKSHGKDGRDTLIIRCDAADSLSVCHEQAKNECPRGFTTISETTGINRKEVRIICKNPVDKITKGTSANAARPLKRP